MSVLFFISLILNIYQYSVDSAIFRIKGTYSTESSFPGTEEYLVCDDYGNYCRYTQAKGILENGTYAATEQNQFELTSDDGKRSCALLAKDGIYLFSDDNTLMHYFNISNILLFVGITGEESPSWSAEAKGTVPPS